MPILASRPSVSWQRDSRDAQYVFLLLKTFIAVKKVKKVEAGPYIFSFGCRKYDMLSQVLSARIEIGSSPTPLAEPERRGIALRLQPSILAIASSTSSRCVLATISKAQQWVRLLATRTLANHSGFLSQGSLHGESGFGQTKGKFACAFAESSNTPRLLIMYKKPFRSCCIATSLDGLEKSPRVSYLSRRAGS